MISDWYNRRNAGGSLLAGIHSSDAIQNWVGDADSILTNGRRTMSGGDNTLVLEPKLHHLYHPDLIEITGWYYMATSHSK
jgi:hypothetical protein